MYINAGNKKIVLPVISRALFPKIELAKRQGELQSIANRIEPASSWKRAYKSFAIAYNTSAHHNNPFYLPLSTKGNGSVFQVYSIPVSLTALRELFG